MSTITTSKHYFQKICLSSSEELYVERLFSKDTFSAQDISFLSFLQQRALALEEKNLQEYNKALMHTKHIEGSYLQELVSIEEQHASLKDSAFQEAFHTQQNNEAQKTTLLISEIRKKLH